MLKDGEEIDKDKYISIVQEKLQILVQNFNALQTKIQKIPKNRFPPIVQPLGPLGMMMLDQSEAAKKAALEYPPVFHQFNAFKGKYDTFHAEKQKFSRLSQNLGNLHVQEFPEEIDNEPSNAACRWDET